MPVPPYTWQTDDYLTASRLQSELRYFKAQPFRPTGVSWHTTPPVFKSFWASTISPSTTAGTWFAFNQQPAGQIPPPWTVIADTAAALGARLDLADQGEMAGGIPFGGGISGSNGGLAIITSHFTTASGSSGVIKSGIGYVTGNAPIGYGTIQPANSAFVGTAYTVDLFDWNFGTLAATGFYQVTNAALPWTMSQSPGGDGSGFTARLEAFWASAYPGNGTAVASVPSITTGYTNSSTLTSAALNAQLRNTMELLNMPPALRVQQTVGQSYTANANTVITYSNTNFDTYSGWNSGTGTYTVPLNGLYLVASFAGFDTFSGSTTLRAGVQINGTNYFGPVTQTVASASANASKVQVFSLNAGDTIKGVVNCGLSGTTATTTSFPMMIVCWLGAQGTPSPLPTPPDTTYMFAAGTPGSQMPGVMNSHFANDLSFLLQRPYLMAYQNAAQSGVNSTGGVPTVVQLQSATGLIHADAGDNYSGWTSGASNLYTAPVAGWYVAVQETFMAAPSLTTNPQNAACLAVVPSGANAADFYQKQNAVTVNGTFGGGGAAAVGLYYLRAGDTIQPQVWSNGTSSTTTATATANGNSHFELVWISS